MTKESIVQTLGVLVAVGTVVITVAAVIASVTGFAPGA